MPLPITIPINRQQLLVQLLCRGDIDALTLCPDGRMKIHRCDDSRDEAHVEPGTTVFIGLVILRLRIRERIESLVLPQAATGAEAHRRLRVWLKWRVPKDEF
ncbi:MAG: hypothetical protein AB1544_11565 [Pseudomonadota bacterium]